MMTLRDVFDKKDSFLKKVKFKLIIAGQKSRIKEVPIKQLTHAGLTK